MQRRGFNANGIAETPVHRALLAVQSVTETLSRVNPRTGVATRVDLGGYALTNGDGLLVRGRTLYVVQNQLNQVAVLKLNRRGTAGALVKTFARPGLRRADDGRRLLRQPLSAQCPIPQREPETADFWITRIDR